MLAFLVSFNLKAFNWIHGFAGHHFVIDDLGIFFAKDLPYLFIIGFLILVAYQESWRQKFYLFAEGALATILARGIITEAIRFFYHHPRPFDMLGFTPLLTEGGWSFPSAHATFYFALALIVWFADRKWGTWYLVLTILMGVARIYVGVHWPYDILGGALIGLFSAWVVRASLTSTRELLEHGAAIHIEAK